MARKAIPKGVRFEVFKRDKFTCQYCGAHPPSVVLHVDHILAVANGGTNAIGNLITACQSIRSFVKRAGYWLVLEAAEVATARFPGYSARTFKYFCGVCWSKIKEAETSGPLILSGDL